MIHKNYKLVRDNFQVIDGSKKLNHQVLLQTFKEFCQNNIVDEKHEFNKKALSLAMCYEASHNHFVWNIRIYETLGLDRDNLLKREDVEEKDLNFYDKMLKKYDLSLNERISTEEKRALESEDPDYDRKKGFMK